MRVVIVLHSHGLGGAERHALGLMRALHAEGHPVLFAGPSNSWLAEQATAAGIPVAHLPMHGFYDLSSMLRLARIARRFKADLLHGHLTRGGHYAGVAARLSGVPCVATAHSTNAGKHFGRANRIIAVSAAVRAFLLERGYPATRIDLVHHGLDVPRPQEATRCDFRRSLGIPDEELVLGMIARFVPDKGHDIALRALALADIPAKLLLVGDDTTSWGQAMHRLAGELGLTDRVLFLGQRDNVFPALAAMDIFIAPSRREALGLALIEAAGTGLPLLGSSVGGIPEIVEHERNGLLLPPEDPLAWASIIRRLALAPELRERFGKSARGTFVERFSTERMLCATEAVYRKTIGHLS